MAVGGWVAGSVAMLRAVVWAVGGGGCFKGPMPARAVQGAVLLSAPGGAEKKVVSDAGALCVYVRWARCARRPDVLPPAVMGELAKLQDKIEPFSTDEARAVRRGGAGRRGEARGAAGLCRVARVRGALKWVVTGRGGSGYAGGWGPAQLEANVGGPA